MHKTEQASYFGAIFGFLVASPYLIGGGSEYSGSYFNLIT